MALCGDTVRNITVVSKVSAALIIKAVTLKHGKLLPKLRDFKYHGDIVFV
jgi:hypothetical protein